MAAGGGIDMNLSSKIDIFITAKDIPKLDLMSPSDPFVVLSVKDQKSGQFRQFAFTEVVWDNPNPEFVKEIKIDYLFEEVQQIRLDFYDADSNNVRDLKQHDYIGYFQFLVGDLVTANGQRLSGQLRTKSNQRVTNTQTKKPTICEVRCEEVSQCKDEAIITFAAKKLPKMDWWGRCDGFLILYRATEDGGWAATAQTNVVKSNYSPTWKPLKVSVQRLCNGDYQRPILIKCFDWNANAEPDNVGEVQTSMDEIKEGAGDLQLNDKKKKNRGTVLVKKCELREKYSFLEFLTGGCEINLMVAVDFTASNGDPSSSQSLHFNGNYNQDNQYQAAIRAVGSVLEPYDDDGMIPAWGFGAKINGRVQHCFPLNMNQGNCEVQGINGLLDAYRNALQYTQLSGPTLFSEIIETATTLSMGDQSNQHYTILLIITDGVINDVQKTIDSIVAATEFPMSLIIVGVGDANFDTMDVLDADDEPLISSRGQKMQADIVQFVPFNKFRSHHVSALSKEVLEEVPDQLTSYFERKGIRPNPAKPAMNRNNSYNLLPDGQSRFPGNQNMSMHNLMQNQSMANLHQNQSMANLHGQHPPPPTYNPNAQQLPPNWERIMDPNSGRPYYVDHNTQQTHWDLPTGYN